MTAKINAVVTPNINIPDTASNGPSSFHRGGNTTSEGGTTNDLFAFFDKGAECGGQRDPPEAYAGNSDDPR
jgi:hypothetical protein